MTRQGRQRIIVMIMALACLLAARPALDAVLKNIGNVYLSKATMCFYTSSAPALCQHYARRALAFFADQAVVRRSARIQAALLAGAAENVEGITGLADTPAQAEITFQFILSIGERHERAGNLLAAEQTYQLLGPLYPNRAGSYYRLGKFYMARGRFDEALGAFQLGARAEPARAAQGLFLQGLVYNYRQEWTSALDLFRQAHTLDQAQGGLDYSEPNQVHYLSGEALRRLNRLDEAEAEYRRAIELDPTNQWTWPTYAAYVGLGDINHQKKNTEAAAAFYQMALNTAAQDAQRAVVYQHLGKLYLDNGETAQAIAHLRQAVDLNPHDAWLAVALADAYLKAGLANEARTMYQAALQIDPGLQYASQQLEKLP